MKKRLSLIAAVLLAGCASPQKAPPPPTLNPVLGEIWWLRNGSIEVAVAPEVGRIVYFGRVSEPGENLLWMNPKPVNASAPANVWRNYGGDKMWYAPQKAWDWPPPQAIDAGPYTVTSSSERGLTMVSSIDANSGLRATRTIELIGAENKVELSYRLDRIQDGSPAMAGAWCIAQLPLTDRMYARFSAEKPAVISMKGSNPTTLRPAAGPWTEIDLSADSGKVGLPADALAAPVHGGTWMLERLNPTSSYPPADRAIATQIYTDAVNSSARPANSKRYVEFEFVSPTQSLAVGQSVQVNMRWTLLSGSGFPTLP